MKSTRIAQIKAAEQEMSISPLVKESLIRLTTHGEMEFDRLDRQESILRNEMRVHRLGLQAAQNLNREELHVR